MLYVGSGTARAGGVSIRVRQYTQTPLSQSDTRPTRLRNALFDGYEMTNIGMLCWIPMPSDDKDPIALKTLVLLLECAFTFVLWTVYYNDPEQQYRVGGVRVRVCQYTRTPLARSDTRPTGYAMPYSTGTAFR